VVYVRQAFVRLSTVTHDPVVRMLGQLMCHVFSRYKGAIDELLKTTFPNEVMYLVQPSQPPNTQLQCMHTPRRFSFSPGVAFNASIFRSLVFRFSISVAFL